MATVAEQLREKGRQQGIKESIQQGKAMCEREIARRMLAANETIYYIAHYTHLSIDEIKKLG